VIDRDLRYSHVSRGGAEVLGLTPAQMSGRSWRELGLPASTMEPSGMPAVSVPAAGDQSTR
jgi:hypothetical protein